MINSDLISKYPLRQQDQATIRRNATWYSKIRPLIEDMRELPYALIKGEALSIAAYGGNGFRASKDIDLLVPRDQLGNLQEIFEKHDCKQVIKDESGAVRELTRQEKIMLMNSHQVAPYSLVLDDGTFIDIDVNCDIFWGEHIGPRIDLHDFLKNAVNQVIYGYEIKVLPPIEAFVQVCLHHYREMNSMYIFKLQNPINVSMFQDIYAFYKSSFRSHIKPLVEYSLHHQLHAYIYYLLYYSSLIFEDDLLPLHMELFETKEGRKLIHHYGLAAEERKQWKISFCDRLNHPDLFSVIEPELTDADQEKIKMSLSIKC
ncbi:nucleotidyltransferase family protein [Paenibacillus polymyxa]|uniref:nucleotidyltransferase family protein n=1 Tax=Paenibacillus polymyxa TaxID=1406 RepID=UPI0019F7A8F8|nr:nucleotidyltransferase family protein [Paenibacillus sp. EKM208P]